MTHSESGGVQGGEVWEVCSPYCAVEFMYLHSFSVFCYAVDNNPVQVDECSMQIHKTAPHFRKQTFLLTLVLPQNSRASILGLRFWAVLNFTLALSRNAQNRVFLLNSLSRVRDFLFYQTEEGLPRRLLMWRLQSEDVIVLGWARPCPLSADQAPTWAPVTYLDKLPVRKHLAGRQQPSIAKCCRGRGAYEANLLYCLIITCYLYVVQALRCTWLGN